MTKLYKLTSRYGTTKNDTKWIVGQSVMVNKHEYQNVARLCTCTVLHAYRHPIFAQIYKNSHIDYVGLRLFEVTGRVAVEDNKKCGARKLTPIRELKVIKSSKKKTQIIPKNVLRRFMLLLCLELPNNKFDNAKNTKRIILETINLSKKINYNFTYSKRNHIESILNLTDLHNKYYIRDILDIYLKYSSMKNAIKIANKAMKQEGFVLEEI